MVYQSDDTTGDTIGGQWSFRFNHGIMLYIIRTTEYAFARSLWPSVTLQYCAKTAKPIVISVLSL